MNKQEIQSDNKIWRFTSLVCFYVITPFFKIAHKDLTKPRFDAVMQFVKFGIVGFSNTVISYVIYAGVLYLLERNSLFPELDYIIASVLAFVLSVLWSYYWNSKKVFTVSEGEKRAWFPALIKTFVAYSFTTLPVLR